MGAKFPYYLMADSEAGKAKEAAISGKPAAPGPVTSDGQIALWMIDTYYNEESFSFGTATSPAATTRTNG